MSWSGTPVIDLDSHIVERADRFYRDYLDPAYHDTYQQLCDAVTKQEEAGDGFSLFGSPFHFFSHPSNTVCFVVFKHSTNSYTNLLLILDTGFEVQFSRRPGDGLLNNSVVSVLHVEHCVADLAE